jgi:hypothetical protein
MDERTVYVVLGLPSFHARKLALAQSNTANPTSPRRTPAARGPRIPSTRPDRTINIPYGICMQKSCRTEYRPARVERLPGAYMRSSPCGSAWRVNVICSVAVERNFTLHETVGRAKVSPQTEHPNIHLLLHQKYLGFTDALDQVYSQIIEQRV